MRAHRYFEAWRSRRHAPLGRLEAKEVLDDSAEEPLREVVAEALASSPEVAAKLQESFDEAGADELREARQFVEECSQRAGDAA